MTIQLSLIYAIKKCNVIKLSTMEPRRTNKVAGRPDTCKMTVLAYQKVFMIIDPTFGRGHI